MRPSVYVTFQGNCREAMGFYAAVFGTEIEMIMSAAEMPGFDAPAGKEDWIAHASVTIGDGSLLGSDDFMGDTAMAGCSVMVSPKTLGEAQGIFAKLADGGAVSMPMTQMFWTAGFGTLTDRFGIRWMISAEEEPASS